MVEKKTLKHDQNCSMFLDDSTSLGDKGTYTLIVSVSLETEIKIGGLGIREFHPGYYAYTGSALGENVSSLRGRISRHLRKDKNKKWHIDFLLSATGVAITAVVAACTKGKMECEINRHLRNRLQAEFPVLGFGSSDCKENCRSHLLYLGLDKNATTRIAEIYLERTDTEVHIFEF